MLLARLIPLLPLLLLLGACRQDFLASQILRDMPTPGLTGDREFRQDADHPGETVLAYQSSASEPQIQPLALAAAALLLTACSESTTGESPTPASALSSETLLDLEKRAMEALKTKDAKFWNTFLSSDFVGYGHSGKVDKTAAMAEFSSANCELESYAFAGDKMTLLDQDVALLTYETTQNGQCGGQKLPAENIAATLYTRTGDSWRAVFHGEAPIVDPQAAPAKPVNAGRPSPLPQSLAAGPGANTDSLVDAEKAIWEAWKDHDGARLAGLMASEVSFVNIFGTYFGSKAEALRDWTAHGCTVKKVSVANPIVRMLSPKVGLLIFDGAADGTCFGRKVGPIWGNTVYVKDGDNWKWSFGMNLPASY